MEMAECMNEFEMICDSWWKKRAELFIAQNGRKKSREAIDDCVFLSTVVAGCYLSWFNIDAKSSKMIRVLFCTCRFLRVFQLIGGVSVVPHFTSLRMNAHITRHDVFVLDL